jgi:drug/metabolite transporter (DMT)-like permease
MGRGSQEVVTTSRSHTPNPNPQAPNPPSTTRATLYVTLAACAFGSITILTTIALEAGATVASAVVLRFLTAAPLLLLAAGWRDVARVGGRHRARLLLLGGGGQAAVNLISLSALHFIPAATLVFLFYTYPAWIAVLAAARGTERVTPLRAAALLLSLAGIATIVGDPFSGALHPTGVLLSLGAAIVYAVYVPLIGRLQVGISPSNASLHVAIGAVVICATWAAARGELTMDIAARGWLAILAMAVFSTVLAFLLFLRGLAVLGAVRTGIVSTVEPFWAALLAAVVLGQGLPLRTLLGGAMIAAAVLLLQLRRGER